MGIFRWANGDEYRGLFSEGQKSGAGKKMTSEGVVVEGVWEDDEQHGRYEVYEADGSRKVGIWERGKFVKWGPLS